MMVFRFSSLTDFLQMGGHGVYVWACALIALVILSTLLLYPLLMARAQLAYIQRQQIMQKIQQAQHQQARSSG